ncbi:SDR family NAD(P)-dependent oxidoreductase [Acuticoccus sp. I52.16.1]|uniref:SDR family NAD(P)-dependent oxidoreductase n=1 Tax=Acuticoccus sp. I52.16.1 TaxID=2928472 RepID=UPI001FD51B20|nr:SDR family NAD(P)-dependent oxidoreductase [Acuticoccus sp. I52.16.1]UOM34329.1 SDR family NAD(P)-dependent oxidoreductase [Acuticoccus sp. I52.16.1]
MTVASAPSSDAADKRARLARLMRERRAAEAAVPARGVWERVAAVAAASPRAVAVEDGSRSLTAAALVDAAEALAASLADAGVGEGDVVALALPRGVGLAVAILAVARRGAAWLPLEADDAPLRRAKQLARTPPVAAIVADGGAPVPDGVPRIALPSPYAAPSGARQASPGGATPSRIEAGPSVAEDMRPLADAASPRTGAASVDAAASPPRTVDTPARPAATSPGADGTPPRVETGDAAGSDAAARAGTVLAGAALAGAGTRPAAVDGGIFAVVWPGEAPVAVGAGRIAAQLDGAAAILPLGPGDRVPFAASLHADALLLELLWPLAAGATVVVAPSAGPQALAAWIGGRAITAAHLTPSTLAQLGPGAGGLRRIALCGEPLAPAVLAPLIEAGVALTCVLAWPQAGGPVLARQASAQDDAGAALGRPTGGAVQIVDRRGGAVPAGVPGTLTVDGRATDLVVRRRRADQEIELVAMAGRRRFVDGRLVDLDAVVAAARALAGVADAAALVRREATGRNVLVLAVVPRAATLPPGFAAALAERLAPWSRPEHILPVTAIPLDARGTADEAALARLPVVDDALARRVETAMRAAGIDAAVAVRPRSFAPGTAELPALTPRARVRPAAECGAPVAEGRPAYAAGGPLVLPPDAPRTLTEALSRTAADWPGRGIVALDAAGAETRLSYADLLAEALRIAGGLAARGLKPGDPVILQVAEHRRYFPAFWGAVLAGLRPVTIAVSATYAQPGGTVLKLTNAWRLLDRPPILAPADLAAPLAEAAAHTGGEPLAVLVLEDLAAAEPAVPHPAAPEDVLFLQLSSGSTGVPKIIKVTHGGVVAHIHGDIAVCGDHAGDVDVNWLPLDHVVPLLTCHLKDTYLGCEQVELVTGDVIADPLHWLRAIARYRATRTWAPNFGFKLVTTALAAAPEARFDLSTVRHLMNAGEQVTAPVIEDFLAAVAPFGLSRTAMQPAFGMAEACTCMTYENGYRGSASLIRAAKASLGGVLRVPVDGEPEAAFVRLGGPVPGVEIRIADAAGATLPEGVIGRFQIRGAVVTPGYVANPEADAQAFVGDGWFNSGDLGVIVDGGLALTGREKETIVVNGANFYCYEVEDVVNAVAGVAPTFAAATAAPSEETGSEGLAVFFVVEEGCDAAVVARRVRGAVASRLGIDPRHVVPIAREDFPKTTSGKIQRTRLKARLDALAPAAGATVPAWFYRETWRPRVATPGGSPGTLIALDVPAWLDPVRAAWAERGPWQAVPVADRAADLGAVLAAAPADAVMLAGMDAPGAQCADVVRAVARVAALAQRLNAVRDGLAGRRLVVVTRGALAAGGVVPAPPAAALRVALRSLAHEIPEVAVTLLDLPADAPAAPVIEALESVMDAPEVAWRDGARLVPRLERVDPARNLAAPLVRGGRYLVTGGNGAIGRALCRWLVERCDASVVALGRRPAESAPPPGPGVVYRAADLADRAALSQAIAEVERAGGALDGVFHLAGAADGRALAEESEATLRPALAAKVAGALHLAEIFAARPDVALTLFGSVNAVFGGAGAGAYAAANAALDAVARQRVAAGGQALAVHWSQWEASPMAERFGLAEFASARGFLPIATGDGLASLAAAMAGGDTALVIGLDGTNPNLRDRLVEPPRGLEELTVYVAGETERAAGVAPTDRFGAAVPVRLLAVDAIARAADGEVDRAALARADGRAVGGDDGAPRSETERRLAAIWADLLGRGGVGRDEDFFAVGGHSLVAARLMLRIRKEFGRELPLRAVFGAPTIAGMAAALDGAAARPPLPGCVVPLQGEGGGAPIFCVHPAGGSPLCYLLLAGHLGVGQPFYGFQAVGLVDGERPLRTVEALAAHYVEAARQVVPQGPLRLAAWSSGGPVAFEMARQVEAAGGAVDLVALFDCGLMESDNPVRGPAPVRAAKGLAMVARYMAQVRWPRSWAELTVLARMIGLVLPARMRDLRPRVLGELVRSLRLFNLNTMAAIRYRPGRYGGRVVLFRADRSRPRGADPTVADLTRFAGSVDVVAVAGSHMSIVLDPDDAAGLAAALGQVLAAQSSSTTAPERGGDTMKRWEGPRK